MKKSTKTMKAFTLVEVIVVMVILAILAALMVPSLTKYIDKANSQSIITESRYVLTAIQTFASENYDKDLSQDSNINMAEIRDLAEVAEDATISGIDIQDHKVAAFIYTHNGYTCTYNGSASGSAKFTVTEATGN